MSKQTFEKVRLTGIVTLILTVSLSFTQISEATALPTVCTSEETQIRDANLRMLKDAFENYEVNRKSLGNLRSVLPTKQMNLKILKSKFDANQNSYKLLEKEINNLFPEYIKAKNAWDSYNARLQPTINRFDNLIQEFNRLISEFQEQQQKSEVWLSVALRYGDTVRANKIRNDIAAYQGDINVATGNINSLNESKNSIYTTPSYVAASRYYNSKAVVFLAKTKKLETFKSVRQQYLAARTDVKQTLQAIMQLETTGLSALKAERDRLYKEWIKIENKCQPSSG